MYDSIIELNSGSELLLDSVEKIAASNTNALLSLYRHFKSYLFDDFKLFSNNERDWFVLNCMTRISLWYDVRLRTFLLKLGVHFSAEVTAYIPTNSSLSSVAAHKSVANILFLNANLLLFICFPSLKSCAGILDCMWIYAWTSKVQCKCTKKKNTALHWSK